MKRRADEGGHPGGGGRSFGRGGGHRSFSTNQGGYTDNAVGVRGGNPLALAQVVVELDQLGHISPLQVDPNREHAAGVADRVHQLISHAPRALFLQAPTHSADMASQQPHDAPGEAPWSHIVLRPISDRGLFLGPTLRSLTLHGLPLATVTALGPIGCLTRLRALRVEQSPALPTEALRELQLLTSLQLLSLNGCSMIEDQAVGYTMPMVELHALMVDDTMCGDVAALMSTVFPKLVRLHMARTQLTDNGLRVIAKRTILTDLSLRGCANITAQGITLLHDQHRLQRICVADCASISESAITALQGTLPNCTFAEETAYQPAHGTSRQPAGGGAPLQLPPRDSGHPPARDAARDAASLPTRGGPGYQAARDTGYHPSEGSQQRVSGPRASPDSMWASSDSIWGPPDSMRPPQPFSSHLRPDAVPYGGGVATATTMWGSTPQQIPPASHPAPLVGSGGTGGGSSSSHATAGLNAVATRDPRLADPRLADPRLADPRLGGYPDPRRWS